MVDLPKQPEQIQVTKRDLDLVKYQLELMRRASWTFPEASLQGQDITFLRLFALDTYMNMRMLYPEAFKGKTLQEWENAIRKFMMTRRPEFRGELLAKLRARYKGEAMDPDLLLAKSLEEMNKKGAVMDGRVLFVEEIRKMADGDESETKGKAPSEKAVLKFIDRNPRPKDKKFHEWAERKGLNVHKAEGKAYKIISDFLNKGKSKGHKPGGIPKSEVEAGVAVEKEHTPNPIIARKVVADHHAETGKGYYPALKDLEKSLKKEGAVREIFMDELSKVAYEGVSLSRRLGKDSPVRGEIADVLKEQRAQHPAQGRITYAGLRGPAESDLLPYAGAQAKKELGRPKLLAGTSDESMKRLKAVASHAPKSSWGRAAMIGVPAAGAAIAGTALAHHLLSRRRKEGSD